MFWPQNPGVIGSRSIRTRTPYLAALMLAWVLAAPSARAQHAADVTHQSLEDFLRGAERRSTSLAEIRALREQTRSQVDEARGRLLPSFTATAGYTRNQNEVVVTIPRDGMTAQAPIQPSDQLDARFALTVPVLDLGSWWTFLRVEQTADASTARAEAVQQDVYVAVATAYVQVGATRALIGAAQRTLDASEANRLSITARRDAGVGTDLDVARATADVERAKQSLADAELQTALAERNLLVLTGIAPGTLSVIDDDLHEERALDEFVANVEQNPSVRAASSDLRAAGRAREAAWMAFAPVLGLTANQRVTNANGFSPSAQWTVGLSASWVLDFVRPSATETQRHAEEVSAARVEQTRDNVTTAIYESWHRVRASIARARAATAAEESSRVAANAARARLDAGAGTQLDVSQTERDLFSAEVSRISAYGDLRVARIALRLRSGLGLPQ